MNKAPFIAGVATLAGLVVVGGAVAAWKYRQMHAPNPMAGMVPPQFVTAAEVKTIPWQPRSRLVGTVVAVRNVALANEVVGVVTDVGFESGAVVEPGQVLVTLNSETEKADLTAAQAALRLAESSIRVSEAEIKMSESEHELAKSSLKRYESAVTASSVSQADLDRVKSEVARTSAALERSNSAMARAKAERDQAAARVAQIETVIAKKTLKAPFKARAGMRTVHPGQYLAEGTTIVSLTELTDDIYLDFAVPQEQAARVSPGMVVSAKSEMLGTDEAKITVVSIDATVNPVTRNVRVRSSVPNPGYKLKPGMFIDVEVPTEAAKPYVVVPATAVRRASFGDHVFVLAPMDMSKMPPGPPPPPGAQQGPPPMTAAMRKVTLGANLGDSIIVLDGLKEGERIAADGAFKLYEGAMVMEGPPPGAAPGPAAGPQTADAGK
ncbi:MAG TPA: efflux RND transporter periplasmic adaptor subunit [Phycisphaerales bacterium]